MMELTDPSEAATSSSRSPLFIDLNEIPSSSSSSPPAGPDSDVLHEPDSYDVVRSIHDNPDPAAGPPAVIPGAECPICGACGEPEVMEQVVVCDGCERGFHLQCVGLNGTPDADPMAEWLCVECMGDGVKSKRWPLGVKSKRILDINSSPPSDGDWEAVGELLNSRMHNLADRPFGGNAFAAPIAHSNVGYFGNGYGSIKGSEHVMHASRVGFDNMFYHREAVDRSSDVVGAGLSQGSLTASDNNTNSRVPSQNLCEILLQSLREFISERHGVLEEGWSVEFEHINDGYENSVKYCSPDGNTFGSMSEVAFHLGLMPNCDQMDADVRRGGSLGLLERVQFPKKRKSRRYKLANGFSENKEHFTNGNCNELLSNGHCVESDDAKLIEVVEAEMEEDMVTELQLSNEALPVQFEDFFVLSLGKIDLRPTYHDVSLVWPVGFKSCWHDKVTRSIFMCEVLDGGDSGPIFRVRRLSCSAIPIPNGSTVLFRSNLAQDAGQKCKEHIDKISYVSENENEGIVEMILADPSPPTESDILSCLWGSSNQSHVQTSDNLNTSSFLEKPENSLSGNPEFGDEIGEILVEERLSSSAWKSMSQKLVDAYSDLCSKGGVLKFFCNHVDDNMDSSLLFTEDDKNEHFASLAKFCGYRCFISSPMVHHGEFDALSASLSRWLDQDRFGLDSEFVLEILEDLPDIEACSKYEPLTKRSHSSTSLTVGSGLLIVSKKRSADSEDSFHRYKKPRLGEDSDGHDRYLPAGRPLCSRLPPIFIGDFYQVWEILWRFHEILGLGEPVLLQELEEELIDPWSNGANLPENLERNVQSNQILDIHRADGMREHGPSSFNVASGADLHALLEFETVAMKDAAQARLASVACTKCYGVALAKAHCSLLSVLISELQSKVAVLVDPSFDFGEPKSRRGRRKDVDNSILEKKSKLSMLPINELTWPELARRYILAVLSMDGNLDSAETTARESSKVFCCLRGDGGVLCGSLTGVVGMEADALLLAEATKQIFGSLSGGKDVLMVEDEVPDSSLACQKNEVGDGNIPEWAQVLEPVRKLPTNVGTRIRKCVRDALEKCPPEWVRKRLEHSISKEVYKGNASGPTKKAVLAVLQEVLGERLQPKSDNKKNKPKISIPISDIIMKHCRIVFRRAAAADEEKVFCTLLGRNLKSASDNDDEGLLGSPAMVSRPLDFRTIDLRLAVGAYGGSYESFLEDVRELWNNVRAAFGDQPDLAETAEKLSQNFESLYEIEVLTLVRKFEEYAKMDQIGVEIKKEIDDVLASSNNIPKAPWDEGVCKVCGVDKDDDSVLLCDTCDAEYHTYCLSPPLARIPEGNWYCPSCVNGWMGHEASRNTQVLGHHCCKKYQGEVTRVYLETLAHLAAAMEEKEYWEFSIDERIFLLKFLCDELLNSALVRQHLEHCAEAAAELQQKLRLLSIEWKNLRSREEYLGSRAAKMGTDAVGLVGAKENSALTKQAKSQARLNYAGERPGQCRVLSDDVMALDSGQEKNGINGLDKDMSTKDSQKNHCGRRQPVDSLCTEDHIKGMQAGVDEGELKQNDRSIRKHLSVSNNLLPAIGETGESDNFQDSWERDASALPPAPDQQDLSDMNNHVAQRVTSDSLDELRASHAELSTIKDDILHVHNSIINIESQLLKLSWRREFLGSDSRGRLYWASLTPDRSPLIIVDGSVTLHQSKRLDHTDLLDSGPVLQNFALSCISTCFSSEGSKACFPFLYNSYDATASCSPWVSYESDTELEELVGWLKDNDLKERMLKESILQWMRSRFHESHIHRDLNPGECQESLSTMTTNSENAISNNLVTKAAMVLEKKYGACIGLDATDVLKKRGKKARLTGEEKMYRCDCLEPIWPSRYHCLSCHKTFANDAELEEHNDGRCQLMSSTPRKTEEIKIYSRTNGSMQMVGIGEECMSKVDMVTTSGSHGSDLSLRLVENGVVTCPFDFEQISTKFLTKHSSKDLVQEIGLIGSNGIPSFLSSISPYVSEATLKSTSGEEDMSAPGDKSNVDRIPVALGTGRNKIVGPQIIPDSSSRKPTTTEILDLKVHKTSLECLNLKRRERKPSVDKHYKEARCRCVVPQSSLQPLVGKVSQVLRQLKVNLLDMEAALCEEAFRSSRASMERRCAWRAFIKSAASIYQMVQATIVFEEMINTQYLRNEWWYWSSLSAAAKTSTIASLALRIYSLDAAILYDKCLSNSDSAASIKPSGMTDPTPLAGADLGDKCRVTRRSNRKRKEPEG